MTTNTRLIAAVRKHNAKPRKTPPPEPLPAGEVAEMVCAYRRGESLTALARRYHHDLTRVRRAGALVRIVLHWMCMRRWPTPEEARWN